MSDSVSSRLLKQIVLYTNEAEIAPEILTQLPDNGYLPIKVARLDAVSVLPQPMPQIQMDMLASAAVEVCNTYSDGTKQQFGSRVLKAILGRPNK